MAHLDFGTGWSLDRNLDFVVNRRTGDIKHDESEAHVRKDIAFKLYVGTEDHRSVYSYLGVMLDDGTLRDLQMDVVGIIEDDERIDTVTKVSVFQSEPETIRVVVDARTVGDQSDISQFVIPVTT